MTSKLYASEKITFDSIQLLRFLAALMVVICHSSFYAFERLNKEAYVYGEGAHGVSLFFVISGFVMVVSSQKLIGVKNSWKEFAVKRIVRIVPIYWIMTTFKLVVMIMAASLVYHSKLDVIAILKSYFFIPGLNAEQEFRPIYGVGWTLNFEMFFYILFCVSLFIRVKPLLFLSTIFVPLALLSFFRTSNWSDLSFYTDSIVLNFLYGMIAGQLILKRIRLPFIISIVAIILSLLYIFIPRYGFFSGLVGTDKLIVGILCFFVIWCAASIEPLIKDKIPNWSLYLGGASYSIYLIHPTVSPIAPTLLYRIGVNYSMLSVVISVTISLASGALFYKYCETPLTKFLSRKFNYNSNKIAKEALVDSAVVKL